MDERYLFRGKDASSISGHWEYGSLIALPDGGMSIWNDGEITRVDPATVGQCSGLRDKNGMLIFESDIVRSSDEIHDGEVQIAGSSYEIKIETGCWIIKNKQKWDFLYTNTSGIEIVGNIHDNPELLESEA